MIQLRNGVAAVGRVHSAADPIEPFTTDGHGLAAWPPFRTCNNNDEKKSVNDRTMYSRACLLNGDAIEMITGRMVFVFGFGFRILFEDKYRSVIGLRYRLIVSCFCVLGVLLPTSSGE